MSDMRNIRLLALRFSSISVENSADSGSHRRQVLRLYKQLYRKGSQLEYTDLNFYRKFIYRHFKQNLKLKDDLEISLAVKRAEKFLQYNLNGLI